MDTKGIHYYYHKIKLLYTTTVTLYCLFLQYIFDFCVYNFNYYKCVTLYLEVNVSYCSTNTVLIKTKYTLISTMWFSNNSVI